MNITAALIANAKITVSQSVTQKANLGDDGLKPSVRKGP